MRQVPGALARWLPLALLAGWGPLAFAQGPRGDLLVSPSGPYTSLGAAVAQAPAGARIVVRAGTYREPTIQITRPVRINGELGAVLDGEGARGLIVVAADDVTIRGLTFRHTGMSQSEDRAALRVQDARRCVVERNTFERTFFGIYLARTADCAVIGNRLAGGGAEAMLEGNGIHVWQSERVRVWDNDVRGHRDGVYFEFVKEGDVRRNVSERNDRYGLHFMFSDDCRYEQNAFRANGAGVAVMYTRRVHMLGNRFERNWGSAAYGLLLKDISDSDIVGNRFAENSVGLHLEGSSRNRIAGNAFTRNGWAVKVLASAQENLVTGNRFEGNSFDVGTNSRQNFSTFRENYWDRYRGYDLDRDGYGDVPHAPVRLFALIVEQSPPTLLLMRSLIVDLLDFAERVLPALTPETLVDARPVMRKGGGGGGEGRVAAVPAGSALAAVHQAPPSLLLPPSSP